MAMTRSPFQPLAALHRRLLVLLLLALSLPALAQTSQAPRRVALVIGNAAYVDKPLVNPVNDATDMAAALRRLGFDVLERTNRNAEQMRTDLADFQDRLREGDVALFFFAGHGVQTARGNYLLPVGVRFRRERDVELHALEAASVLRRLEEAKTSMSMVVLDACRDNPLPPESRSADSRGLARMDASIGSLIAFATAPGRTADENRQGRNGLYTQKLLRHIETPGLSVEEVFKRVRTDVIEASRALPPERRQVPEEVSKLIGDFQFRAAVAPPPLAPPGASPGFNLADLQREQQARVQWQAWQGRMQGAYDKVLSEGAGLAPDLRVQAWRRYLEAWKGDNPLSQDDEVLRARAQQQLEEAQKALRVAVTPSRRSQPAAPLARVGDVFRDCDLCPELVVIGPGSFLMGSPATESGRGNDEGPQSDAGAVESSDGHEPKRIS
jgi:hypothetical protein